MFQPAKFRLGTCLNKKSVFNTSIYLHKKFNSAIIGIVYKYIYIYRVHNNIYNLTELQCSTCIRKQAKNKVAR